MRMRGAGRSEGWGMVALLAKAIVVLAVVIGLGVGSVTGMPIMRAYADDVVSDTDSSAGSVRLADQEAVASDAIPENPGTTLPNQVSESIPDDATVVSEDLAVTNDGEVKDLETGETVTDPAIVGTQDAPADPLAKTDGKSFIPVDASEVKEAVSANGGDANASTADQSTADQSSVPQSSESSSSDGVAHVTPASFTGNEYGAHWGTYNGTSAFFDGANNLFAQQAKGVIDVSEWQGDIDWAAAKADGVQGAIIRIGFGAGNRIDAKAQRNINECKRLGIPFGVYLYSYTEVADSGDWEGDDTVTKLRQLGVSPDDLTYPVFYDLEDWTGSWTGHRAPTDPNVWNGAVNKWYAKLQAAGYNNLGVYSYTSYLNTSLNTANIRSRVRWIASYGARTGFDIASNDRGWQYTANGRINGVNGAADLNAFGNYEYQAAVDVRTMSAVSVPDGDYYINAMIKDSSSVEIPGGSMASGARTQLYGWNKSGAQRFKFAKQSDGSYVIANTQSGLALDVVNGSAVNGAAVQQYTPNGTAAQRWFIRDSGAGYYLQSALGNWVLGVSGASAADGTAVTLQAPNGTEAQRFVLASVGVDVPTGKTVKIESAAKSGLVMAVAGSSKADAARAWLYTWDAGVAQLFVFKEVGNGVYQVTNPNSGKAVEIAGASAANGATVQQYAVNGTKAQHWSLINYGSGNITFVNNASAKAIDIPAGNASVSVNLQLYTRNGTMAQQWKVSEAKSVRGQLDDLASQNKSVLADGTYAFASAGKGSMVLDVAAGSRADMANVQLYSSNGTNAQRWKVSHDAKGYVTLTNVGSGKVLDVSGASTALGANVQQYASNGSWAQKWIAVKNADGSLTLRSALGLDRVLDVASGQMVNGANAQLYSSNGTVAQKWRATKA